VLGSIQGLARVSNNIRGLAKTQVSTVSLRTVCVLHGTVAGRYHHTLVSFILCLSDVVHATVGPESIQKRAINCINFGIPLWTPGHTSMRNLFIGID
jgi:hypothetical protein